MDAIIGTWKNKQGWEENMSAFMDACKIPEAMRQVFLAREYEISYAKADGENMLTTNVKVTNDPKLKPIGYTFQLGKEFECADIDGKPFKCTIQWNGEKFLESYIDDQGVQMNIERLITPEGAMKFTMTCHGVSATSIWERS